MAALAALTTSSIALAQTDSPWLDWVAAHSPHGFDVTPDGTIWINLAATGRKDDYAIRAGDLREARASGNKNPIFWVRGYHLNNPGVRYRQSKIRYNLNCANETISTSTAAYFAADDSLMWQSGYVSPGYIVPGTYAAEYYRLFCLVAD